MPSIAVPILVEADDGFDAFDSVEAACGSMEAVDVENGVYRGVFDARGARLRLSTLGYEVLISGGESEPSGRGALTERVRNYLAHVSARIGDARFRTRFGEVDLKNDSLERLVAAMVNP